MKKNIIIILLFFVFAFLDLIFVIFPQFVENRDIKMLKRQVSLVNDYVDNKNNDIDKIRTILEKNVTSNKHDLELSIDNYLNQILNIFYDVKQIDDKYYNDIINVDFNKNELSIIIDNMNNYGDILNNSKQSLTDINTSNFIDSNNEELFSLFNSLIKKIDIDELISKISSYISNINDKIDILNFLNNNQDFYNIDNRIIFTKRSKYNEFNDIVSKTNIKIDYEIIDDNVGPIIKANNISISEGDNLSIEDKVSCIDEVDDEVVCDISGSYNTNVVGVYIINIKAKDSSNNESSKDINVIVKEKTKYNLPYIIEVIRNQSTTIVYGQDDNGEYTKIVGVFPCSPGAGTNTPVGTFYSRRGYEWGGLFGGVYGQYSTIITGHVLFHSVPYRSMNKDDLKWEYYNRLGSKDSMGCVRLTVRDAKWIYDNCPNGTMIKIYDGDLPSGVSKPSAQKIDPNDPRRGWDPTDPDPANPWNQ